MEEWRDIKGYEGYQASSYGNVRSKDRVVTVNRCGKKIERVLKGRILKPAKHSESHPYPYFQAGLGKTLGVHVAVAIAFHGERPLGMYACHKDGNPENCTSDNVYWGTPKQNQFDRVNHGRSTVRENHPMSKLTEEDVSKIRDRLKNGELQREIAMDYGVTQSSISLIKTNTHWRVDE